MSQSKEPMSLPPLNPRREALAQACRALYDKKKTLYKIYPNQIDEVESEYIKIIRSLEEEIIEIDHREFEQARKARNK